MGNCIWCDDGRFPRMRVPYTQDTYVHELPEPGGVHPCTRRFYGASREAQATFMQRRAAEGVWQPVGPGTPLNTWLETRREGVAGTKVLACRISYIGDEPEWLVAPRLDRSPEQAPTHWRYVS
jgi:hypothetical protein